MKDETAFVLDAERLQNSIDVSAGATGIPPDPPQHEVTQEKSISELDAAMRLSPASGEWNAFGATEEELLGRLDLILETQERAGLDHEMLKDAHAECRSLREGQHVQEVLLPIMRSLIRVADRTRHELASLRRLLREHVSHTMAAPGLFAKQLIEARRADLVEVEATLAAHGVVIYNHPSASFVPRVQTCIKPIPTGSRERDQRVVSRVLPGYRRNEMIIQPERVTVHVYDDSARE